MTKNNELFLHEEILLLALRDREGTTVSGAMYPQAIGGAVLAELLLRDRIRVEDSKKKRVELVRSDPVGDPVIDECLAKIAAAKRGATLQGWVGRFAGLKKLKDRVARRLCERGILRAREKDLLLIFSRTVYPEIDPEPERELIERLGEAIFSDMAEVDPRTVVLLSLAHGTGLLKTVFDKKDLKGRRERIEQVVNGERTGKAARQAVEAMQAAVVIAAVMPAICATTAGR